MNLTHADGKVDTVVGDHTGVTFDDTAQDQARWFRVDWITHAGVPLGARQDRQCSGAQSAMASAEMRVARTPSSSVPHPSCSNCAAMAIAMAAGDLLAMPA